MARSDGAVYIQTLVDTKGFGKGMNTIEKRLDNFSGAVKKLGGVIATVFAVEQLVKFGKESIKLGSDLQEVQNVVDVTFTSMSKQVDEFAKNAAKSAGLSQTMAKRYVGTFGAMAKAFGFAEQDAFNMSTTLTQLAGDVASFYNITQDEAYTKLKSVFSGETETLKELGIVMTQSALDAYAMAKGFGKTTKQMSEQEKVALRYSFVINQLSSAQGDFVRTSDSWANQTRILSLNFETFKANIGKALITIFTPLLKILNQVVEKMAQLSSYFVSFTEMLFGKSSSGGGGPPNQILGGISDGYDEIAESATKAEKAQKKYLTGLDEIRTFTSQNKTGSEAGAGIGNVDFGNVVNGNNILEETNEKLSDIIERAKELADLFKKGFADGLGDTSFRLDEIKNGLKSIRNSLAEIFDADVKKTFNKLLDKFAYSLGQIAGSFASIGLTIGANLIGGLAKYLQSDKKRIKQFLIDTFDFAGAILEQLGNFSSAFAYIFEVIASESGQKITSHIIGIFSELFMGIVELGARFALDITKLVTQPFIDAKEEIRISLEDVLIGLSEITTFLKVLITDLVTFVKTIYDEVISPIFDNLTLRITEIIQNNITPLLSAIGNFLNTIGESLLMFWNGILKPLIGWIIENILPVIVPIANSVLDVLSDVIAFAINMLTGFVEALDGIITFLNGAFSGNWRKAWEGIKKIFEGVMTAFGNIVKQPINAIIGAFNGLISGLEQGLNRIIEMINSIKFDIPDWVPKYGGLSFSIDIPKVKAPKIPYLATGAVIPPNAPFLAMLGDQKNGTNVEAPLSTIEQAVRNVVGNGVGQVIHAHLYLDGKEILTSIIDTAKFQQATTGLNPLLLG